MSEPMLLLSDRSPTLVRDAAHMLALHTEANDMAEHGFPAEAISRFRDMRASGITPEHCTFEDMLSQIFEAARLGLNNHYDSLEAELLEVCNLGIACDPSNKDEVVMVQARYLAVRASFRRHRQCVSDMAAVAQSVHDLCRHGMDDEVLAWIEATLPAPAF